MTRIERQLLVITALMLLLTGCKSQLSNSERVHLYQYPGEQWLSWNSAQRETYIYGYLDGYGHGAGDACLATDDLFEKDQPHRLGYDDVPSTFPSSRCLAEVPEYSGVKFSMSSGPDFTPYMRVLTEFYTKHPDKRDIPLVQLMSYMAGPKIPTADELYRSRFQ